jgi:DNA polymerase-3 subunit alpha
LGINRKSVEKFVKAGAFDIFCLSRQTMLMNSEALLKYYNCLNDDKKQIDIFAQNNYSSQPELELDVFSEISREKKLKYEFEVFGFYLKDHPLDIYQVFFNTLRLTSSAVLNTNSTKNDFKIAGVILSKKVRSTMRGKYAFLQVADLEGIVDLAIFDEELLLQNMQNLEVGKVLLFQVEKKTSGTGTRIIIKSLLNIKDYISSSRVSIYVTAKEINHVQLIKENVNSTGGVRLILKASVNGSEILFGGDDNMFIDVEDLVYLRREKIRVEVV